VQSPYDVREVIARLVDASEFAEFKTGVRNDARHQGSRTCTVIRSHHREQRVLLSESAQKGAHFIELSISRGVRLLFLQNISGS